jgi:hypothetical protein
MTVRARLLAGFAAGGALLGALALSPAQPVAALEQSNGAIRVTENQTVEKEYGPIAIPNPAPTPGPAPRTNTPENCKQATYCDVIPLEIVLPPDLQPRDEFFVTVTVDWQTDQLPGIKVGEAEYKKPEDINDLDSYVWTDPPGEEPIPGGATEKHPEETRMYRPVLGKYSIVVFNYGGPNKGYKVKVEYKKENIAPPFELLAPGFDPVFPVPESLAPPVELTEPETPAPPARSPSVPATPPGAAPASPPGQTPAPLTPVAIEPDPDFTNFADDAFDDQLAAPPARDVLREKRARAVGPPKPASSPTLIFWLAVVPLLLLAGGGVWLSRRGSAVLRVR